MLWYDSTANDAQLATLRGVAKQANGTTAAKDKFIVSSWDDAYGTFPQGKHFALSHWSAEPGTPPKQSGNRQLCGDISGAVVNDFITKHPLTSAPEPGAQ